MFDVKKTMKTINDGLTAAVNKKWAEVGNRLRLAGYNPEEYRLDHVKDLRFQARRKDGRDLTPAEEEFINRALNT
jgi:hypothetical protein